MRQDILGLIDYKGHLFTPFKGTNGSMNLQWLKELFAELGFGFSWLPFPKVAFREPEFFADRPIIYNSSQDRDLMYKSYIEDVVLGLEWAGARLIPGYRELRAHHNKVFMEIYRDLHPDERLRSLRSRHYGTLEEFRKDIPTLSYPLVIKAASGDQSKGVALIESAEDALVKAKEISRSFHLLDALDNQRKLLTESDHRSSSNHRRKFIVQQFVPNLDKDWKIVVMGNRLYVSVRYVAEGDFRASGSKAPRAWPDEVPHDLLDYTQSVFQGFNVPFASLDVLHDGQDFHLGEFQFLRFGCGPVMNSPHYWERGEDGWRRIDERSRFEPTYAKAVAEYLNGGG